MPNNDISISLPSNYQTTDKFRIEKTATTSKPKDNTERIELKEIPDSVNKVRRKVIKGIVRHGGI